MTPEQQTKRARKQSWIRMVGMAEAEGRLKELYDGMKSRASTRPAIYSPPTGDAANIVKAHSLDPEGLRLAFACSTAIHWSEYSLPWEKREMINTVTSKANNCDY